MNTTRSRASLVYLLFFAALIFFVFFNFQSQTAQEEPLTINQVAADIQSGQVARLVTDENNIITAIASTKKPNYVIW